MTKQAGIGMTSARTRQRMVERLRSEGIKDETVLAVMAQVPRHLFVDEAFATRAYDDVPLPIGFGQTISSPYIVARMSEVARSGRRLDKVLEIGTGCGYQTAVLSKLAREVYSVERIGTMLEKARANLRQFRLSNTRLKHGDGSAGLPEVAPFDAIVVTAAAAEIPRELLNQLAIGGRLVIPVGVSEQALMVVERTEPGFVESRLEAVRFVPLVSGTA